MSSAVADLDIQGGLNVWEPYGGDAATDENINAVAVSFKTDMENKSDAMARFYLSSEIYLYYNGNTDKLSYKISEWKVAKDSDFVYDDNKIDVWKGD